MYVVRELSLNVEVVFIMSTKRSGSRVATISYFTTPKGLRVEACRNLKMSSSSSDSAPRSLSLQIDFMSFGMLVTMRSIKSLLTFAKILSGGQYHTHDTGCFTCYL